MNTRSELVTELQAQLLASSNASIYPESRLITLIQNAYQWAAGLHNWQALNDAKKTTVEANQYYYDYPDVFKDNSIYRIEINDSDGDNSDDEYDRKAFEDFLDYRNNYPSSTKRIFANHGKRYFIAPTPTARIENGLVVWGNKLLEKDALDEEDDTTIFSYSAIEGNEAIVRKAFSTAIKRIDRQQGQEEETVARGMLAELWNHEIAHSQRDQRIQHPKFDVPDFFGAAGGSPIGRFNYDPSGLSQ